MKVGFESRRTTVASFNDFSERGVLVFNNLSEFLQGGFSNTVLFSPRQQVGNTDRHAIQDSEGFYIQDSIRLSNRLTINAGLRWDYFGVIHEKNGLMTAYDPTAGLVARSPLYNKDFNNFAPRLSVAWDVTGKSKTVVRSGSAYSTMIFRRTLSPDRFTRTRLTLALPIIRLARLRYRSLSPRVETLCSRRIPRFLLET